jgi:hypothetical protein
MASPPKKMQTGMKKTKDQKRIARKAEKAAWKEHQANRRRGIWQQAQDQKRAAVMERFPLHVVQEEATPRDCGGCTACCGIVGVKEIDKPAWSPCQHVAACATPNGEAGCGIYQDRPGSCKHYWCMYSGGFLKGGIEMRPDRLGVILDAGTQHELPILGAWELVPGALDSEPVKRLFALLGERMTIYAREWQAPGAERSGRRVCGPLAGKLQFQEID